MKLVRLRAAQSRHLYTRACWHIDRSPIVSVLRDNAARHFLPLRSCHPKQEWCFQLTSSPRFRTYSTSPATLTDPSRPSLFYHLLEPPNPLSTDLPVYAVSLLERPPKDPQSPAVMGWLPAALSDNPGTGTEAGLGDFKENPNFLDILHQAIREAIDDGNDERLTSEAIQLGQGWMHVNDDRHLPEMGRISTPDDIIASVRVEDGKILPETYSPMPAYRICTTDGLTTLSKGLEQRLLEALRRIQS